MQKKRVAAILTFIISLGMMVQVYAAEISFKDVSASDWYAGTVTRLVELGGIGGYPDETFKPGQIMSKAEFIKTLVGSLGLEIEESNTSHWADNYIKKALELGLIEETEKNTFQGDRLNAPITRQEMAKIAVLTATKVKKEALTGQQVYIDQIKDYSKISTDYKSYVLTAYTNGIIAGYPDNNFKPNNSLTRAEACTVIIRILEPNQRQIPEVKTIVREDVGDVLLNKFLALYPNNATAVVDGAVSYHPTNKPKTKQDTRTLAFDSINYLEEGDYYIDLLQKDTNSLKAFKDVLKLVYPTEYEKVYDAALKMWDAPVLKYTHRGTYDNRRTSIHRNNSGIDILVAKIGAK
ncbi:MAG: S-layer homology domain-containing protein [Epulopiscium sp.]|nr:S-layer homology domain-containing protein [Candidatus Epulonipiscium sp.]